MNKLRFYPTGVQVGSNQKFRYGVVTGGKTESEAGMMGHSWVGGSW